MSITFDELKAGPALPEKHKHIDALGDSIIIKPISAERVKELQEKLSDATELGTIIVAASLCGDAGLSLEEALEVNKQVQAKVHPAAWDEIQTAIMEVQMGKRLASEASSD